MRTEKALKLIKEKGADALLLFNESNMHYFCGFAPSEGIVLILKNGCGYHIVDSRYTETAQNYAKKTGLIVQEPEVPFADHIAEICKHANIRKIDHIL